MEAERVGIWPVIAVTGNFHTFLAFLLGDAGSSTISSVS